MLNCSNEFVSNDVNERKLRREVDFYKALEYMTFQIKGSQKSFQEQIMTSTQKQTIESVLARKLCRFFKELDRCEAIGGRMNQKTNGKLECPYVRINKCK